MRTRGRCWLAGIAAVCLLTVAHAQDRLRAETLALVGGRVLRAPDAPAIDNATVVIESDRIINVGTRGQVAVPVGARIVDCAGWTIVAAFQNSHVHFTESKWDGAENQSAAHLTMQLEAMFTRYGFTTVVDAAS